MAGGGEHGRRKNTGDTALKIYAPVTPVHHQHVLNGACHLPPTFCQLQRHLLPLARLCFFALSRLVSCTTYQNRARLLFVASTAFRIEYSFVFLLPARLSESSTPSYFCRQYNYQNRARLFYFCRTVLAFKMGVKIFWNWHGRLVFTDMLSLDSTKIV